jgi:hypothetical protein
MMGSSQLGIHIKTNPIGSTNGNFNLNNSNGATLKGKLHNLEVTN